MSLCDNNLQDWLWELGKAQRDGAFAVQAARYPWQEAHRPATGLTSRRLAWVRAAVPLAAAAAVAVLFVGPALWHATHREGATMVVQPERPATMLVAEDPSSAGVTSFGDFNGDGVVNGADVQAFLNQRQQKGSGPDAEQVLVFVNQLLKP